MSSIIMGPWGDSGTSVVGWSIYRTISSIIYLQQHEKHLQAYLELQVFELQCFAFNQVFELSVLDLIIFYIVLFFLKSQFWFTGYGSLVYV